MSVWEYKVISSGKGGFASPALLEKFLGDLGRDEWEIIHYQTQPDNPLAFSGLARRSTQRDWTLEGAAAAAAKAEAEKLRAEFEAKFKGALAGGAAEEPPATFLEDKLAPDDGFRKPVDTSHDSDPEADEEETKKDDWDKLTAAEEDELPTFFEAMRPHMRRNQRGPGMSVGVDYLAKKWDQSEDDIKGALLECGFIIPEDEDAKPEYVEYDGDLFWVNENRRGELWINTKEKPRPVFRPVKAERVVMEEAPKPKPKPEPQTAEDGGQRTEDRGRRTDGGRQRAEGGGQETGDRGQETGERTLPDSEPKTPNPQPETAAAGSGAALPSGRALLERIRPMMRRNRRGPGGSGSASFLSRALKCSEADLTAAFVAFGFVAPIGPSDQPVYVEIGNELWWLNQDSRGGLWINGRDKRPGETVVSANAVPELTEATASAAGSSGEEPIPTVAPPAGEAPAAEGNVLSAVRGRLKAGKGGAAAAKVEGLAEELGHAMDEFVTSLVAAGLTLPEKPREKPAYVERNGESFWLSRNAKGELWLNAKPAKSTDKKDDAGEGSAAEPAGGEGEKKSRRPRARKKEESTGAA